jgi:hypothetical protein
MKEKKSHSAINEEDCVSFCKSPWKLPKVTRDEIKHLTN